MQSFVVYGTSSHDDIVTVSMSRRICQAIEEYHAEKGQAHADSSVLVIYIILLVIYSILLVIYSILLVIYIILLVLLENFT